MSESSHPPPPAEIDLTGEISPPPADSSTPQAATPPPGFKPEFLHPSMSLGVTPVTPSGLSATADRPLTIRALDRAVELQFDRLAFSQVARDAKICKVLAYVVTKPRTGFTQNLVRQLQASSTIDEIVDVIEGKYIDGPHPTTVAGEKAAEASTERMRADLLDSKLQEYVKKCGSLNESLKVADAYARSMKEQVARLEDKEIQRRCIDQAIARELKVRDDERARLEATIKDCEATIALMKTIIPVIRRLAKLFSLAVLSSANRIASCLMSSSIGQALDTSN
ncbi:hypothetical protein PHYBOEH_007662 [Phytophthora boehmeriae]|uniref:Uncharacterized protein n=1 Tax=Phytophthora boehmeriae TaxID=109152 RepID=A0A8T1WB39_9STRA|nr:hypothetical protein PHYBOEH_007662 [Phytophthora boehmeriae]